MKVSVCIPVYKARDYIARCARSLFEQTLADIEFVFVDDCSGDDSIQIVKDVLKDYPEREPFVRFFENTKNSGPMETRLRAVAESHGDWIAFCDADDWVDVNLYAKMVSAAERGNAQMVMCDVVRNENAPLPGAATQSVRFNGSGREFLASVDRILAYPALYNKLFSHSLLKAHQPFVPQGVKVGEDQCFVVQYVARCDRVTCMPDVRYHYFSAPDSIVHTLSPEKFIADSASVYEALARFPGPEIASEVLKGVVCNILYWSVKFSVLPAAEFQFWQRELCRLRGRFGHPDATRLRMMLMRIAFISYRLAVFLNFLFSKKERNLV